MDSQAERTRQDIIRLCHAGLDSIALRSEIVQRLRKVMPVDGVFFATVDPTTLLFTSAMADDMLERATPQFLENEFQGQDANTFTHLARDRSHVRSLHDASDGDLENSARYRDILAPMALGDELRAALVIDDACWGVMCLHRERGHSYTGADAAYLSRLVPFVAEGLRTALVIGEVTSVPTLEGPGVVMLADDFSVIASTRAADYWLAEIAESDRMQTNHLPRPVTSVAARLLALERGDDHVSDRMPRVRLRTARGHWLVVHAARLGGATRAGQIAVVIEEALPSDVAPLVLKSYGLTARETEIAGLVLRGMATAEIVQTLYISADTIQDHLKSVFDKVGVRSRRDLVAAVFKQQYLPSMQKGVAPASRGGFRVN